MNVLMICVDQWPYNFFGLVRNNEIMTPTLDTLAANGIRFTNVYSECPVCIPARRSLMTGLSPRTHGDRVYSDRLPMPDVKTLAQSFRDKGYQATAVGKLHVYPQRDRIGFDEAIITEEGRYEFGEVDDYQIDLGEEGLVGEEFAHAMGNNTYYTRPWHLAEKHHPTNWVTKQMMKQIKRKDPTRPAFFYCSYQFPHPPLVPLSTYWDMYSDVEFTPAKTPGWGQDEAIFEMLRQHAGQYSPNEMKRAQQAYYAQCTHIDHQIRLLIGTLRESNLLDDTLIVFLSDHGEMLFNHGIVGKRCFYEESAKVPLIISGKPLERKSGTVNHEIGCLADIMPTVLDLCGIEVPETVEGISLFSEESRDYLYGEVGEGAHATRMIREEHHKLIYYPYGNVVQLFDLEKNPEELVDCSSDDEYREVLSQLTDLLIENLYGEDLGWIVDEKLVGLDASAAVPQKLDFGLNNQRGYHWPTPSGYAK